MPNKKLGKSGTPGNSKKKKGTTRKTKINLLRFAEHALEIVGETPKKLRRRLASKLVDEFIKHGYWN